MKKPKMGRPKVSKADRRSEGLSVTFTPKEKKLIVSDAATNNVGICELIRRRVLQPYKDNRDADARLSTN